MLYILSRWCRPDYFHLQLEFRDTRISSGEGLLTVRDLIDPRSRSGVASTAPCDNRKRENTVHPLDGLFCRSAHGRKNNTAWAGSWCRPTESANFTGSKSFVLKGKRDQPTKSDHLDLKR